MKGKILAVILTRNKILISFLLLLPSALLAHGEDKPGPHGGQIRMPGAFHTELILMGKGKAKIYLLDMHWKNPTLNGKVGARLGKIDANCHPREDSFLCEFPKGSDLSAKGILTIRAQREGKKGMEVSHELPLK